MSRPAHNDPRTNAGIERDTGVSMSLPVSGEPQNASQVEVPARPHGVRKLLPVLLLLLTLFMIGVVLWRHVSKLL